jgi:hypothetical protein
MWWMNVLIVELVGRVEDASIEEGVWSAKEALRVLLWCRALATVSTQIPLVLRDLFNRLFETVAKCSPLR